MSKTKLRALITGNQGFIGAWTSWRFHKAGFELYGLDNRASYGRRLFDEAKLEEIFQKQFSTDVANVEASKSIVAEVKPDIIVNLAGQAIIPRAFKEPFSTFMTNAVGTLSMLEAARTNPGVKSVICVTSDKVYENLEQVWPYRETDKLGGKDIYSVSKSTAELMASSFARTHLAGMDVNVQSVRLGNVVGGGDWSKDRLVPDLMYSIVDKTPFFVRYANAIRPFQHVLDVVEGIFKIGQASLTREKESGNGWNLGPRNNSSAKVADVIRMCKEIWPDTIIKENENKVKEDLFLAVDVSKFKHHFCAPKYESHEALRKTFKWYERYLKNPAPIRDLIESEFSSYEDANERL